MKVRRGRTPRPDTRSLAQVGTESGQITSTIWVAESTRLSTNLTVRSLWRTRAGGTRQLAAVGHLRGFWRISAGTGASIDLKEGRELWLSHQREIRERVMPPLEAIGSGTTAHPLGRTEVATWERGHESSESQPRCPELEAEDREDWEEAASRENTDEVEEEAEDETEDP